MSYYDNGPTANPAWPAARPPWDSRVGASVQMGANGGGNGRTRALTQFPAAPQAMKPEDPGAFSSQLDEVDRAVDNLVKSGKMYPHQRRDSMPLMAPRGFPQEHVPGIPPPQRHYSGVQDFEAARPHSASTLQTFYANQRFQPRPSETDQVLQAKRRIAAQRERELRNYHQEQQYNRTGVSMLGSDINNFGKERVISPGGLGDEDRQNHAPRPIGPISNGNAGPSTANSTRGPSPMSFDPFGIQNGNNNSGDGQLEQQNHGQMGGSNTTSNSPERSRTNSVAPQSSRTSASSPTGAHEGSGGLSRVSTTPVTSGVAPIGTRPTAQLQNHGQSAPNLQKRSTTPLPSPLSYGFTAGSTPTNGASNDAIGTLPKERSGSAASNASASQAANGDSNGGMGTWKPWGQQQNKSLGTMASVWG